MDYGFETQAGFYRAFPQCISCTLSEYCRHCQLRKHSKLRQKLLAVKEAQKHMDEIESGKTKAEVAKKVWENIFSANTSEEVKQQARTNAEKGPGETAVPGGFHLYQGHGLRLRGLFLPRQRNRGFYIAIGMEQCGRIPGGPRNP